MNNEKLENQLQIALDLSQEQLESSNLNAGYNKQTNMWEVIVKYNGDLYNIQEQLNIGVEVLSNNYAIITLTKDNIYNLLNYNEIEYIELPKLLTFFLESSRQDICISPSQNLDLTGKGTIVAIIDSGINYTNNNFKNEDGTTRILYIWDQTIEGNPPEGFLEGSVYTQEDINNALNSANPTELVPHMDNNGHGTAVAGIAAAGGNNSGGQLKGVAPESELIIVKIGSGNQSFAKNTQIMRGIKFILDKAIELNKPVAINISFGTNDGSHTGRSLFETYIDDMCNIWKTSICIASGNEGNTAKHYKNTVQNGEKITIEIEVSSFLPSLYIVLFKNFVDLFDINVISPAGLETNYIDNFRQNAVYNFADSKLYINLGQPAPYTLEQGIFFELIANENNIETGIWKIEILGQNIIDGAFDIWLPTTEASSKNTKFLSPNVLTTLTIPSTASNVITVGGYDALTNSIASFSGRGFTKNNQIKPDLVAPALNIRTISNVAGYTNFTGTSAATPFVTGACSLLMQWGIVQNNDLFLYGERLKAFLRLGAKRKDSLYYPNQEWGYGSLCIAESLRYLKLYKNNNFLNNINILEANLEEGTFYSEDYLPLVAEYNLQTEEILQKYDFIKICKILDNIFVVFYIKKDKINSILQEDISKISLQIPIPLGLMDKSALDASGVLAVQNQPFLNLKGDGVLVGIVDTGINYTLKEFIYKGVIIRLKLRYSYSIELFNIFSINIA